MTDNKWKLTRPVEFSCGEMTLKRPSLLSMIHNGAIPNPLIQAAEGLVNQGLRAIRIDEDDPEKVKERSLLVDIIVCASVADPVVTMNGEGGASVADIPDDDKFEILLYVMGGIKALEAFRDVRSGAGSTDDSE